MQPAIDQSEPQLESDWSIFDQPIAHDTNPTLGAALEYAALGLRVIPLYDRSKKPRIEKWQKKATIDTDTISGWFEQWPDSNVGIAGGLGLVILDVDPKNGGTQSLKSLLAEHGLLPLTAEARTGSGGSHFFFRVDPLLIVKTRGGFRPGLDIRADRGQVVAAPSIHPDGNPYEWVRHPREGIAPIPAWLLKVIQPDNEEPRHNPVSKPTRRPRKPRALRPRIACHGTQAPESNQEPTGPDDSREGPPAAPLPSRPRKLSNDVWLSQVIERFPVPHPGVRRGLMVRAVGSMAGQECAEEQIIEVMMAWHAHFYKLGRCLSDGEVMERELRECLADTRNNPGFRPAWTQADYEAEYAQLVIPDQVLACLKLSISDLNPAPEREESKSQKHPQEGDKDHVISTPYRVTRSNEISVRLCVSSDERQFMESLLAIWILKRSRGERILKTTHDQIRRVATSRFKGEFKGWDNKQFDRLKAKYVSRLDARGTRQAASRFELLREVVKGCPPSKVGRGTPSEYEPTGIELLLLPPVDRASTRLECQVGIPEAGEEPQAIPEEIDRSGTIRSP